MNTAQRWAGLPDHIKREAAPAMLAGKDWYHFGRKIEHPGADELRKWAGLAPQSPQAGSELSGSVTAAGPAISERHEAQLLGNVGDSSDVARSRDGKPMTQQQKRDAVDLALSRNIKVTDRELARKLGVSHTFIALRRRKAGNVAGSK